MKEYTIAHDKISFPEFSETTFSLTDPHGELIVSLQVAEEERGYAVYKIEGGRREPVDLDEDLETALDIAYTHALMHYENFVEESDNSLADLVTGRNLVSLQDRIAQGLLEKIIEKPEILDEIRQRLEEEIIEDWEPLSDRSEEEGSGSNYDQPFTD